MNITPKQKIILDLGLQGLNTIEIAERLNLSPYTISTHLRFVRAAMGVHTTVEAIEIYKKTKGKK